MQTFIITGASSCGKTTTITELGKIGYLTRPEAARELLHTQSLKPLTDAFQHALAARQIAVEDEARARGYTTLFLDRGLYENAAFCKYYNLTTPQSVHEHRDYTAVFMLEALGIFEKDGIRIEKNEHEARKISTLIRKEYERRSIPCVSIPVNTAVERAGLIMRHLSNF